MLSFHLLLTIIAPEQAQLPLNKHSMMSAVRSKYVWYLYIWIGFQLSVVKPMHCYGQSQQQNTMHQ